MLPTGHEIGKYLVLDFLGKGHFGAVYRVMDRALSVERALKILKVSDPTRYVELLEAQIQYKCRHENCVTVNSADVLDVLGDPHVCIDMELVKDGSLERILNRKFLSVKFSCHIICDISYGLEHAHNQGVLHKDIKPGNILIHLGTGKLSDFGVSEYVGIGGIGGGKAYITHQPPEFFSKNLITIQSDVYSLGITLFRCLNNITDWDGVILSLTDPNKSLRHGTLISDIGWQPWVPKKLRKIVGKACASDPNDRYDTVRKFRQALERLNWQHDWQRIDPWKWVTEDGIHCAYVNGPNFRVFEHSVNGRRKTADRASFGIPDQAQRHLHAFIESTTLA